MKKIVEEDGRRPSATFRVGAIALVFLVIGFEVALFIYKASVTALVSHRDRPDTVYVVDRALAKELLTGLDPAGMPPDTAAAPVVIRGKTPSAGPGRGSRPADSPVAVRRDAPHTDEARAVRERFTPRRCESFPFNPNTATEEDFQRLGFSEKQAQALTRYREKGGRFRRKEDFARSFVVSDSVYRRLEAYIVIPLLDLNTADSAAFEALPGIGPFYAGRMVAYRKELGGYSHPGQLMDLWKFDREKYDALADLVTVSRPYRYPLWSLPEDSLRLHPYIRSRQAAHGIVLFREGSPRTDWTVDNLVKAGILKPEMGERLSRCAAPPPAE